MVGLASKRMMWAQVTDQVRSSRAVVPVCGGGGGGGGGDVHGSLRVSVGVCECVCSVLSRHQSLLICGEGRGCVWMCMVVGGEG